MMPGSEGSRLPPASGPTAATVDRVARWLRAARGPGLAAVGYLAVLALAQPGGDFPLNDDWSYARAAQTLASEGAFRPTGWTGMPLLAQALWGAAFVRVLGFSFEVLRASTIALALASALAALGVARRLGAREWIASLTAAVVLVNPIAFGLSTTFMTDVPFLGFAFGSLFYLARALESGRALDVAAGTALAVLATLTRQIGLFVPLGFAAACALAPGHPRRRLVMAVLPLAVAGGALALFEAWLSTRGLPAMYHAASQDLAAAIRAGPAAFLPRALQRLSVVSLYLGAALMPLLLVVLPGRMGASSVRRRAVAAAVATTALGLLLLWLGAGEAYVPRPGSMLWDFGIGPPTLSDVFFGYRPAPGAPPAALRAAIALAVAGAAGLAGALALLATELLRPSTDAWRRRRPLLAFLAVGTSAYLAPILLPEGAFFDRYFVPLVALAATLVASGSAETARPGPLRVAIAALALSAVALVSTVGVHDYFAWNRARWAALEDLVTRRQVPPWRVDGGFEFNGWMLYSPDYEPRPGRAPWWVHDAEWVVAFGPIEGYAVESRWPYRRWYPPGPADIVLLRRESRGTR